MFKILFALIIVIALVGCTSNTPKKYILSENVENDSLFQTTDNWDVKVRFPVFNEPFSDSLVAQTILKMKADFIALAGDEVISENWKNELIVNSEISVSNNLVSVVFKIYEFTGGAHGNTSFKSLCFDPNKKEAYSLSDFFNGAVLSTIQKPVRAKLKASLTASDFVDVGTETMADFSVFSLSDSEITFWFAPYQVASYAEGVQEVSMPIEGLANFVWPE